MKIPTSAAIAVILGGIAVGLALHSEPAPQAPAQSTPTVEQAPGTPFLDVWMHELQSPEPPASHAATWQDLILPPGLSG